MRALPMPASRRGSPISAQQCSPVRRPISASSSPTKRRNGAKLSAQPTLKRSDVRDARGRTFHNHPFCEPPGAAVVGLNEYTALAPQDGGHLHVAPITTTSDLDAASGWGACDGERRQALRNCLKIAPTGFGESPWRRLNSGGSSWAGTGSGSCRFACWCSCSLNGIRSFSDL